MPDTLPLRHCSYIPPSAGFPGGLLLRLANITASGAIPESIGFAPCNLTGDRQDGVVCGDLDPNFDYGSAYSAQDPRAFL